MAVALGLLTPTEYLKRERENPTKSELLTGQIHAMAGASERHNLIVLNVGAELHAQLRRKPCRVYPSDMRVRIDATNSYTYPDLTVVCGEPKFEDEQRDTLLNPTVIVEVLSKTTESYDRGRKFQNYRTLESLTEYLLIAQETHRIEHYVRQDGGQWLLSEATTLVETIHLPTIGCQLSLAEVYDKVDLDPASGREESVNEE